MITGEPPDFWWARPGWQAALLSPAAALYGAVARRNLRHGARAKVAAPVLCVGNPIVGGGGKTPTALALAEAARREGFSPGLLSRGHGGTLNGPVLVETGRHSASDVGDEALLLARGAPTAIARDRASSARLLTGSGCDFIIMDDGFQSARLHTDLALLVVDARRGIGNARVMPSGPLRAPIVDQMRHADAILLVGSGEAGREAVRFAARADKPVHAATIAPREPERFAGRRVLAFAGIADPEKFYRSLLACGAQIGAARDFPDHHPFTADEIAALRQDAKRGGLTLVTTAKDAARLRGAGRPCDEFLAECMVLEIDMVLAPADLGARLVRQAAAAYRERQLG